MDQFLKSAALEALPLGRAFLFQQKGDCNRAGQLTLMISLEGINCIAHNTIPPLKSRPHEPINH
jgi:hypothetical protein